eukprot:8540939-Alexandrium_andersonii.AAC.1
MQPAMRQAQSQGTSSRVRKVRLRGATGRQLARRPGAIRNRSSSDGQPDHGFQMMFGVATQLFRFHAG